jgi:hypothetical protein
MRVKINFTDFWPLFDKNNNYFINLLSQQYEVEISDDPDFLFYSCYGNDYLKYKCIRIFFSAENMRPDFSGCDFAMTFDYNEDLRHYRLPLYYLYIIQYGALQDLAKSRTREEAKVILNRKTKFCCMVVSNPHSKKRIDFFHELSKYKHVDSGGRYLNNVGGPVANKLDFIKDYKFVIAFENSSYPGYTTEKIVEPFVVNSIPIYWGNQLVEKEFNKKSFVNYDDSKDPQELINKIREIDENEEMALQILMQPKFGNGEIPECINDVNVMNFLNKIISNRTGIKPVAISSKKIVHSIQRRKYILYHYIGRVLNKNFR